MDWDYYLDCPVGKRNQWGWKDTGKVAVVSSRIDYRYSNRNQLLGVCPVYRHIFSGPGDRKTLAVGSWLLAAHQCLHHVGLVVAQRFHDVEHVDDVLLLDHLAHTADGTEGSAAAASVSKHRVNG